MSKAYLTGHFLPAAALLTDERPRITEDALMDDLRPAMILAEVESAQRHRGQWRRVLSPVGDMVERLLLAARSVA